MSFLNDFVLTSNKLQEDFSKITLEMKYLDNLIEQTQAVINTLQEEEEFQISLALITFAYDKASYDKLSNPDTIRSSIEVQTSVIRKAIFAELTEKLEELVKCRVESAINIAFLEKLEQAKSHLQEIHDGMGRKFTEQIKTFDEAILPLVQNLVKNLKKED